MKKALFGTIAGFILMLGAHSASAGLLTVKVGTAALGGSGGSWSLVGPVSAGDSWLHVFAGLSTWDVAVTPGDYDWSISGTGLGFGVVGWSLAYNGDKFFSGGGKIFGKLRISDSTAFAVVPEPGTLGLLGAGLIGLAWRRRSRA